MLLAIYEGMICWVVDLSNRKGFFSATFASAVMQFETNQNKTVDQFLSQ